MATKTFPTSSGLRRPRTPRREVGERRGLHPTGHHIPRSVHPTPSFFTAINNPYIKLQSRLSCTHYSGPVTRRAATPAFYCRARLTQSGFRSFLQQLAYTERKAITIWHGLAWPGSAPFAGCPFARGLVVQDCPGHVTTSAIQDMETSRDLELWSRFFGPY